MTLIHKEALITNISGLCWLRRCYQEWVGFATVAWETLTSALVPREGVEPSRPYGQRILSLLRWYSPQATTRYQAVFTDVSAVKGTDV